METQTQYPALLTCKEVEKPNRKSQAHCACADGSGGFELLSPLNIFDAVVDVANLCFVAPQSKVVDAKRVERVGLVDADQIAAAIGKDGQNEGRRREERWTEAADARFGSSIRPASIRNMAGQRYVRRRLL